MNSYKVFQGKVRLFERETPQNTESNVCLAHELNLGGSCSSLPVVPLE